MQLGGRVDVLAVGIAPTSTDQSGRRCTRTQLGAVVEIEGGEGHVLRQRPILGAVVAQIDIVGRVAFETGERVGTHHSFSLGGDGHRRPHAEVHNRSVADDHVEVQCVLVTNLPSEVGRDTGRRGRQGDGRSASLIRHGHRPHLGVVGVLGVEGIDARLGEVGRGTVGLGHTVNQDTADTEGAIPNLIEVGEIPTRQHRDIHRVVVGIDLGIANLRSVGIGVVDQEAGELGRVVECSEEEIACGQTVAVNAAVGLDGVGAGHRVTGVRRKVREREADTVEVLAEEFDVILGQDGVERINLLAAHHLGVEDIPGGVVEIAAMPDDRSLVRGQALELEVARTHARQLGVEHHTRRPDAVAIFVILGVAVDTDIHIVVGVGLEIDDGVERIGDTLVGAGHIREIGNRVLADNDFIGVHMVGLGGCPVQGSRLVRHLGDRGQFNHRAGLHHRTGGELNLRQEVLGSNRRAITIAAGTGAAYAIEIAAAIITVGDRREVDQQVAAVVGEGLVEGDHHAGGGAGRQRAGIDRGGRRGGDETRADRSGGGLHQLDGNRLVGPFSIRATTAATTDKVLHRADLTTLQAGEHAGRIDGLRVVVFVHIEAVKGNITIRCRTIGHNDTGTVAGAVEAQILGGEDTRLTPGTGTVLTAVGADVGVVGGGTLQEGEHGRGSHHGILVEVGTLRGQLFLGEGNRVIIDLVEDIRPIVVVGHPIQRGVILANSHGLHTGRCGARLGHGESDQREGAATVVRAAVGHIEIIGGIGNEVGQADRGGTLSGVAGKTGHRNQNFILGLEEVAILEVAGLHHLTCLNRTVGPVDLGLGAAHQHRFAGDGLAAVAVGAEGVGSTPLADAVVVAVGVASDIQIDIILGVGHETRDGLCHTGSVDVVGGEDRSGFHAGAMGHHHQVVGVVPITGGRLPSGQSRVGTGTRHTHIGEHRSRAGLLSTANGEADVGTVVGA